MDDLKVRAMLELVYHTMLMWTPPEELPDLTEVEEYLQLDDDDDDDDE